jgi:sarcosine oxidase
VNQYDVIVVGVGGIGSSTLYHLARRGVRVLGLDRFSPGHDRGSSHGQTRMFRRAYYESPRYLPLIDRSFTAWQELAEIRGTTLFHEVGLLQAGPRDGVLIRGLVESADAQELAVEELDAGQVRSRFPGFEVGDRDAAYYEAGAGYLDVEACVTAYAEEAVNSGAELLVGGAVRSWTARSGRVTVETESKSFTADRLVIVPGPWAKDLLLELCIPFEVRRKPLYWYQAEGPEYRAERGAPCFLIESGDGIFYGFPQIDDSGLKVGEHTGGVRVPDPLGLDRGIDPQDQKRVEAFLAACLPGVHRRCVQHTVCMYTMSPDSHFVVDRHPDHDNVVFAAGFSGHGFKFASALGEHLTRMVLDEELELPLEFLGMDRAGLRFTDLD